MQTVFSRFRPRLIPALATLALCAVFVHLGLWQAGKGERAAAQRALYAARSAQPPLAIGADPVAAADYQFAAAVVRGEYEPAGQFYLDNQVEQGRPGVHVITPLKIAGGDTRILVNRGWAAWADRRAPPRVAVPAGVATLTGIAVVPMPRRYLLMPDRQEAWPQLRASLDLDAYAQTARHPVQPVILRLTSAAGDDGLVRNWPPPEDKVAMHRGYALQWFGMACVLVVFFLYTSFRKAPRSRETAD